MKKLYPIYFHPVYKNAVWGGQKISTFFNRNTKEKKIAESWEISDRKEGMSKVANGFYKGADLCDLMNLLKNDLTGDHFFKEFPLLIKLIDAHDKLSIQVHPDQKSAKKLKGKPKEDMIGVPFEDLRIKEVIDLIDYQGIAIPEIQSSSFHEMNHILQSFKDLVAKSEKNIRIQDIL